MPGGSDIYYLQSQNGNVYRSRSASPEEGPVSEFDNLKQDIPEEIPWCSEALGTSSVFAIFLGGRLTDWYRSSPRCGESLDR